MTKKKTQRARAVTRKKRQIKEWEHVPFSDQLDDSNDKTHLDQHGQNTKKNRLKSHFLRRYWPLPDERYKGPKI